jgi:hypothetical protein
VLLAVAALARPAAGDGSHDGAWGEIARDEDVVVYHRRGDADLLPSRRAVGTIEAGIHDVLAVLSDVEHQVEWTPRCREARVLRREGAGVTYVYNRTDMPWPAADRDAVLRTETRVLEPGQRILVRFTTDGTAGLVGETAGVVRVPRLEGHYLLSAMGPAATRVEYEIDTDLGGRLPKPVLDWAMREVPLETFIELRRQVIETLGADRELVAR